MPAVGRRARLELAFERRRGRTVLAHSYAEPPFRVARTFDLEDAAYAILVCAGPGVFGGDALTASVHVGRGARVVLASQAALQAHPSASPTDAPARLRHAYIVEDDGELHCQWDPLIPFARARVDQRFDIRVAASGRVSRREGMVSIDEQGSAAGNRSPVREPALERLTASAPPRIRPRERPRSDPESCREGVMLSTKPRQGQALSSGRPIAS